MEDKGKGSKGDWTARRTRDKGGGGVGGLEGTLSSPAAHSKIVFQFGPV